jgi:hypothetical protein
VNAEHHRVRLLRVVLADAENLIAVLVNGMRDIPDESEPAAVDVHVHGAADEFGNLDFLCRALEQLAPEFGRDALDDRRFHRARFARRIRRISNFNHSTPLPINHPTG